MESVPPAVEAWRLNHWTARDFFTLHFHFHQEAFEFLFTFCHLGGVNCKSGFPDGTSGKNPPANTGDVRDESLIPGTGRSPGEGNGNPLQYFCLENPMDRRAWRDMVHRVAKSWAQLKRRHSMHACICISEVVISPSNLDSSLCFIQPSISHDVLCI